MEKKLLYARLTFRSELKDEAILPPFKGSTFRGAFGTALKQVVCALRHQDCQDCLLAGRCVYAFFFEKKDIKTQAGKESGSSPHPFAIEPPLTTRSHFQAGECFDFNLILFGRATDYMPYWIYAFEQMGRIGIGKHINGQRNGHINSHINGQTNSHINSHINSQTNGQRAKFVLKSVSSESNYEKKEKIIYSSQDQRLAADNFISELVLPEPKTSEEPKTEVDVKRLTIHLKTPLRVKYENHLTAALPFSILIRSALRRISSLFTCYGDGNPDLDYQGLVERSQDKGIEIEKSDLHWFDWERYSNRQEVKMLMGGMTGSITYTGQLGEFLPMLQLCEKVHLGKQTTFGLGWIEVEEG